MKSHAVLGHGWRRGGGELVVAPLKVNGENLKVDPQLCSGVAVKVPGCNTGDAGSKPKSGRFFSHQ